MGVDKDMEQEVIDSSETQGDESPREFFIRLFIEMSQARLILYKSELTRFSHLLGMFAFSIWKGKGYLDELEGLSGSERTNIPGITHPPRTRKKYQ